MGMTRYWLLPITGIGTTASNVPFGPPEKSSKKPVSSSDSRSMTVPLTTVNVPPPNP